MDNQTQQNLDEGWRDILGNAQFQIKDILGKERTRGIARTVGSAGEGISRAGKSTGKGISKAANYVADLITKFTGGAGEKLKSAEGHIAQDPLESLNALTGKDYMGGPGYGATHHWPAEGTADEMRRHQIDQLHYAASRGLKGNTNLGPRRAEHAQELLSAFQEIPERELRYHAEDARSRGRDAALAAVVAQRESQKGKKTKLSDDEIRAKEAALFKKISEKTETAYDKEHKSAVLSKLLGTLAYRAGLYSAKEREARADKEDFYVGARGHERVAHYDPVRYSQEFEPHHGGHGHMGGHPVAIEYRAFFEKQGDHTLPHPDELFDVSKTAHVQDEFAEFLPDELRKYNAKNSRAFKASADIARSVMGSAGPTISQQSVPFKMMESKQYNPLVGRTKDVYAMRYGGFPRQLNG